MTLTFSVSIPQVKTSFKEKSNLNCIFSRMEFNTMLRSSFFLHVFCYVRLSLAQNNNLSSKAFFSYVITTVNKLTFDILPFHFYPSAFHCFCKKQQYKEIIKIPLIYMKMSKEEKKLLDILHTMHVFLVLDKIHNIFLSSSTSY